MKIISRDFGRSLINPLEISKSRADRLLSSWLSQKARVSSRIPNKFALMHPRGCNGLHAICKCVGQVAFQQFLRIPLVTTLPPIFFARFVRLTLAEWTFQSWLAEEDLRRNIIIIIIGNLSNYECTIGTCAECFPRVVQFWREREEKFPVRFEQSSFRRFSAFKKSVYRR